MLEAKSQIFWCGFIFDAISFEVRMDYLKYTDGTLMNKVSKDQKNIGLNVARKLKQTISWKCNPLAIDRTVNSHWTVCLNMYQLFLFCGMKMHVLLASTQRNTAHSHRLLIGIICDVIGYMWVCIKARTSSFIEVQGSFTDITEAETSYLGIIAFQTILTRKKKFVEYRSVLESLSIMLSHHSFECLSGEKKQLLQDVIVDSHHDLLLKKIHY